MPDALLPSPLRGNAKRVLWPVLVISLLGILSILVAGGVRIPAVELAGRIFLLLGSLGGVALMARGRGVAAVALMATAFVVVSATSMLGYGSVRSVGAYGLVGAVVMVGTFLERRALLVTVGCSIALVIGFSVAEVAGVISALDRPIDASQGLTMVVTLGLVGFTVHYSRRTALRAAEQLERELHDRKQDEARIRSAEERLRLSMEASRQGWFDLDVTTGVVVASPQFSRIVGADPSAPDLSLQAWIESIHHDDRPAVLDEFQRCLRSTETHQMEYRMKTLAGTDLWIRSIAKVVQRDAAGKPIRMMGTHADITDQMQVTMALQDSERQYRALVELSPLAIVVLRDELVVFANAAAVALFGATSLEALVGTPLSAHVGAERWDCLRTGTDSRGTPEATPQLLEQHLQRADGELVYVTVHVTPIIFEGTNATQLTCQDVSRRKLAEASLLRSRQLESLGTLAGGIAHDFNNILLAVRGNAELAAEQVGPEHQASESLKEIVQASARASAIVRRITAFGRPQEPDQAVLSLPAVIDEVLGLLRPTIPSGIALRVEQADALPSVLGDTAQLHEVIVNLTTNAVDAIGRTRTGEITFTFDTVHVEREQARSLDVANGHYVQLSVSDTGCGMDADTMARAFDAFFTTKPVGEGSGLGLPMVYGILKSHGGSVLVNSTPGQGTSFQLYLPIATNGVNPDIEALPTALPSLTARRVLFVDDEAPLVRLAERTLSRVGHHVEGFTDPAVALEEFVRRPHAFDIIVTDLTMPHMSGLEFARAARAIRADVPIVMATGDANAANAEEVTAAGIRFVAVKAAAANQLVDLVERGCREA
jgi:PAS domain S-box-containing protein